jgi:hypothetical protein
MRIIIRLSARLLDNHSLELLAVGTLHEHLVAREADGRGGVRAELARNIAAGGSPTYSALYPDHDGRFAARALGEFTQDFLFSLSSGRGRGIVPLQT